MAFPPPSHVRQNYHPDCEAAINRQINLELSAAYAYEAIACYLQRGAAALGPCAQFLRRRALKEREQAERLMWLQNQRGGCLLLDEGPRPPQEAWESCLRAVEFAMRLAQSVSQSLLHLHGLAAQREDAQLGDFLQRHCLQEQGAFLKELGDHLTHLRTAMGGPESRLPGFLCDSITLDDGKKD